MMLSSLQPLIGSSQGAFYVDFLQLKNDIPLDDFHGALKEHPMLVLPCLAISVHQTLTRMDVTFSIPKIHVRMNNYKPLMSLKNLKSSLVDKFISIRGNVVRVTGMRPLVVSMEFVCTRCEGRVRRRFIDGNFNPPTACEGKCKSRAFTPDVPTGEIINWQKIRVQEIVSSEQIDQGRIPRTIECELTDDLVDSCMPGDTVVLTGIVKARKIQSAGGGRGPPKSLSMWYIEVNSMSASVQNGGEEEKLDVQQFTDTDLEFVVEIASQESIFRLLVHSLCPSIYGHEIVKAGLLLGLFGGVRKNTGEKERVSVRGDPHILLVGDPGLGKSQMLRATAAVAPRGVYVCGNTTTTTGLTVTMVREGSDFALEAGALVLADQGCCCIDGEFYQYFFYFFFFSYMNLCFLYLPYCSFTLLRTYPYAIVCLIVLLFFVVVAHPHLLFTPTAPLLLSSFKRIRQDERRP